MTPLSPLTLFVPYHAAEVLAEVPGPDALPFVRKLHLPALRMDPPEWQDNRLAEARAVLSPDVEPDADAEYVGLLNARSHRKYGWLSFRWDDLPGRLADRLRPDVVLAPWGAGPDWARFSDIQHPGMIVVLRELAEWSGLKLEAGPSLWANDFVCARAVWDDWRAFFRRAFLWAHSRWGLEPPTPVSNYDPPRRPAYLYERFTTMYFANWKDLKIVQL